MAEKDYKGKILRLFRTIMLLNQTPFGLTAKELGQKSGCSTRTIYRDLQLLEEIGFIPEEIEDGKFALRGMDREVKKFEKNLNFNAEEAGILTRAVAGIPENHPLKENILTKLRSFSGMEEVIKGIIKSDRARVMGQLARAVKEKKQVALLNYRSAHSQSVRSRVVEPYAFSRDGVFVKCFEVETQTNKTFKLERIEEVEIQKTSWKFSTKHETQKEEDIFGFRSGERHRVILRMSMRAAQLLQEEHPLSSKFLIPESARRYYFEARVNGLLGVSRFILGLIDEIEVVGPAELKSFLRDKIKTAGY